jgi:hypothetical protein
MNILSSSSLFFTLKEAVATAPLNHTHIYTQTFEQIHFVFLESRNGTSESKSDERV